MTYKDEYHPRVKKDLKRVDVRIRKEIKRADRRPFGT